MRELLPSSSFPIPLCIFVNTYRKTFLVSFTAWPDRLWSCLHRGVRTIVPRSINDMLYRLDAIISMVISGEIESPGFENSSKLISDILSS
jgi:hypothetical protein